MGCGKSKPSDQVYAGPPALAKLLSVPRDVLDLTFLQPSWCSRSAAPCNALGSYPVMQDVAGSGGGAAPCCACAKAEAGGELCAGRRAAKAPGCRRALWHLSARPARPRHCQQRQRRRAQAGAGRQNCRCACTCALPRQRQHTYPGRCKACTRACGACGSGLTRGSARHRKPCSRAAQARGRTRCPRRACRRA